VAIKTGSSAELRYKNVAIGKVRDATLTIGREAIDCTSIGDYDRRYIQGVRSTSGSGTLLYDSEDTATRNIMNRILNDSEQLPDVTLILDSGATAGTFVGNVVLTQVGVSVSAGSITSVPISFTFDGKVSGQF